MIRSWNSDHVTPQQTIAHYRITSKLGEGAMGEVWRATDTKLNRSVAIKILPESFGADPDRLGRFTREAHVLASLNHPGIASIYGVEERALILELVEGPTLAEHIAGGALPASEALPIAREIAAALEYAHEHGIVHRDLKPANIKLTPDGRVKLLDFGLAKALEAETAPADPLSSPTLTMRATMAGVIMGTPAYMSPEQAKGKTVDRRGDIWAFGVVLYEMVSGSRPFEGADYTEMLASVVRDAPDLSRVPSELRRLISRCLEKDPSQRLRHIGDVMELVDHRAAEGQSPVRTKTFRLWPVAAVLLLALSALLASWAPWPRTPNLSGGGSVTRLALIPPSLTIVAGNNFGSAISPDGSTFAFVGRDKEMNSVLYLRALNSLEARMISGSEGAGRPFWSPDSKYVAWFAARALWKMPVTGGAIEKVTPIAGTGRGGAWNREGVILFADQNNSGINRVPEAGGTTVVITQFDAARGEDAHYYPQFLPDGRRFLYYRRSTSGDRSGMYLGTLDDPKKGAADPLVVASEYRAIYGSGFLIQVANESVVAQSFDAARVAFSGSPFKIADAVSTYSGNAFSDISVAETGVFAYGTSKNSTERTLRWFDRKGKALATVGANISEGDISISPDGTRVMGRFTDRNRQGNWVLNLERGTRTRVTSDPPYNDAVWSPSSNEIAYLTPGIEGQVFIRPADGSGAPRKVPGALLARGLLTDWTPDGRLLSYGLGAQAQEIFETPVAGGKPRVLIGGLAAQAEARLSPDGQWIAYTSVETSRSEVYVVGKDGSGGKWQISANGGASPRWRRDGREIIYMCREGLVSVPVTLSGRSFSFGKPVALFAPSGPWDTTPDFSRVLVAVAPENENAPFIILQNWTRLLK